MRSGRRQAAHLHLLSLALIYVAGSLYHHLVKQPSFLLLHYKCCDRCMPDYRVTQVTSTTVASPLTITTHAMINEKTKSATNKHSVKTKTMQTIKTEISSPSHSQRRALVERCQSDVAAAKPASKRRGLGGLLMGHHGRAREVNWHLSNYRLSLHNKVWS